jgi:hypothetical protein
MRFVILHFLRKIRIFAPMSFTIQRQTKEAIPARLKSIPENAGTVFM